MHNIMGRLELVQLRRKILRIFVVGLYEGSDRKVSLRKLTVKKTEFRWSGVSAGSETSTVPQNNFLAYHVGWLE